MCDQRGSKCCTSKGANVTRIALALILFASMAFTQTAAARDVPHMLKISDALARPDLQKAAGKVFTFKLGDESAAVDKTFEVYVAKAKQYFRGKDEDTACLDTFAYAISLFKKRADKAGGDAVINVTSFYHGVPATSDGEFECHGGSNGVTVVLRGTIVKLKPAI